MEKKKRIGKIWLVILCVFLAFILLLVVAGILFSSKTIALEDSKLFDKEMVKQNAEEVIGAVTMDNYTSLLTEYANETLATDVSMEAIRSTKEEISTDWGLMQQIVNENYYEMEQAKIIYAVAIMDVKYENVTVTYTLSFDTDMKLAGIYLK